MRSLAGTSIGATLLLALLAGCTTTPVTTSSTSDTPQNLAPYQLDCASADWSEPCLRLASHNDATSKAEVDIAVNPTNPLNVFIASKDKDPLASRKDDGSPCVWAVGQVTFDGGKTWNTTYVGGKLADRAPGDVLYGWECITDPILAFEADGTLHYSLQVYKYRPNGVADPLCMTPAGCTLPEGGFMYHAISHDGGRTFPEILLMHAGDETVVFHDFMRMGTSPTTGTTFTLWDQLTGAGGAGFSFPVLVAVESGTTTHARAPVYFPNTDQNLLSLGAGATFGDRDGTVYVWLSGFNSGGRAVLATSDNDGMTFTTPKQVFSWTAMDGLESHPCGACNTTLYPKGEYDPQYRTGTIVELAPDLNPAGKGCLYATWGGKETVDGNGSVGGSDMYVRASCDKGNTWTDPVLVNAGHREDAQWMPRVSVDGRGTVHLVYFTRAYDPEHNLVDAEHAWSLDGGRTWTTERLTAHSFDANLGIHQDGFPFIGDYIGIASVGDHTYMGFPTTVTGRAELAVAHSTYYGAHLHTA